MESNRHIEIYAAMFSGSIMVFLLCFLSSLVQLLNSLSTGMGKHCKKRLCAETTFLFAVVLTVLYLSVILLCFEITHFLSAICKTGISRSLSVVVIMFVQ